MALFKKSAKSLDADQIRSDAAALADSLAEQAERAAEWVAPRVVRARHSVTPGGPWGAGLPRARLRGSSQPCGR